MLVPGWSFQPSEMLVGMVRFLPKKGAPERSSALPTKIRLSRQGLSGTSTLARNEH